MSRYDMDSLCEEVEEWNKNNDFVIGREVHPRRREEHIKHFLQVFHEIQHSETRKISLSDRSGTAKKIIDLLFRFV